jgi:hypothetical protein
MVDIKDVKVGDVVEVKAKMLNNGFARTEYIRYHRDTRSVAAHRQSLTISPTYKDMAVDIYHIAAKVVQIYNGYIRLEDPVLGDKYPWHHPAALYWPADKTHKEREPEQPTDKCRWYKPLRIKTEPEHFVSGYEPGYAYPQDQASRDAEEKAVRAGTRALYEVPLCPHTGERIEVVALLLNDEDTYAPYLVCPKC